jgi:hypothetical protein
MMGYIYANHLDDKDKGPHLSSEIYRPYGGEVGRVLSRIGKS